MLHVQVAPIHDACVPAILPLLPRSIHMATWGVFHCQLTGEKTMFHTYLVLHGMLTLVESRLLLHCIAYKSAMKDNRENKPLLWEELQVIQLVNHFTWKERLLEVWI